MDASICSIQTIQELVAAGARLVVSQRLLEAFDAHRAIVKSLVASFSRSSANHEEEETCIDSSAPTMDYSQHISNRIVFRPISQDAANACPGWESDIFPFPFIVVTASPQDPSSLQQPAAAHQDDLAPQGAPASESSAVSASCAAVCLFNMALCVHLEANRSEPRFKAPKLQKACKLYEKAFASLQTAAQLQQQEDGSRSSSDGGQNEETAVFLFMAICTNLSQCHCQLGQVAEYNQWVEVLRKCYSYCCSTLAPQIESDPAAFALRNFFSLMLAVNQTCVSAAAA